MGEPEAALDADARDAAAAESPIAAEDSSGTAEHQATADSDAGIDAATSTSAAAAAAEPQAGWNQMQGQLPTAPPPGFQPVMPGGMMGMMTPDGFIPGSASLRPCNLHTIPFRFPSPVTSICDQSFVPRNLVQL